MSGFLLKVSSLLGLRIFSFPSRRLWVRGVWYIKWHVKTLAMIKGYTNTTDPTLLPKVA